MTVAIETLSKIELANILFGKRDDHIHWYTPTLGINKGMVVAFNAMQKAAKANNIDLAIASGFRDFDRQLVLWNNKFTDITPVKDINNSLVDFALLSDFEKITAIMLFSAIPGLSRHHWGTDIDVYSPSSLAKEQNLQLEPWEYEQNGPMAELSLWLKNNAANFGFYFPYDKYRKGVAPEPWHLSFWPLAKQYQHHLTQDSYASFITKTDSEEFAGLLTILDNLPYLFQRFVNKVHQPNATLGDIFHG